MKAETSTTLRAFLIELAVYAVLVTGYFFLVLHFLSGWLQELHLHHVKALRAGRDCAHHRTGSPARKCHDLAVPPSPRSFGISHVFSDLAIRTSARSISSLSGFSSASWADSSAWAAVSSRVPRCGPWAWIGTSRSERTWPTSSGNPSWRRSGIALSATSICGSGSSWQSGRWAARKSARS